MCGRKTESFESFACVCRHVEGDSTESVDGRMAEQIYTDAQETISNGLDFNGVTTLEGCAEMLEIVGTFVMFDKEVVDIIDNLNG